MENDSGTDASCVYHFSIPATQFPRRGNLKEKGLTLAHRFIGSSCTWTGVGQEGEEQ